MSEQLIWDAEHAPQNVGLSHNVLARTSRDGDSTVVEAITKVQSIDLVADPASTAGLFEHAEESGAVKQRSDVAEQRDGRDRNTALPGYSTAALDSLTLEELQLHRPDLVRELQRAQESQVATLRHELDALTAHEAATRRRERIVELLEEHDLPLPASGGHADSLLVSPHFIETLMRATDDTTVRRLVEERAELVRAACLWNGKRKPSDRRPRAHGDPRRATEGPDAATDRRAARPAQAAAEALGALECLPARDPQ